MENFEDSKKFTEQCEAEFEKNLSKVVDILCHESGVRIITLTGPSCAGKTTAAAKLIKRLDEIGKSSCRISIDDFYFDRERLFEISDDNGKIDYDSEKTIDMTLFGDCIERLIKTGKCRVPVFDFTVGASKYERDVSIDSDTIIIIEGIQVLYPGIREIIGRYKYVSLCINAESPIDINGEHFSPIEIRLMRRIVRDYYYRDTMPYMTLKVWESVRENEEKNIYPFLHLCDHHIDSTLKCEIGLLKPYLDTLLPTVDKNDKNYRLSHEIKEKIKNITAIDAKYLSDDSLYYEFIKRPEE